MLDEARDVAVRAGPAVDPLDQAGERVVVGPEEDDDTRRRSGVLVDVGFDERDHSSGPTTTEPWVEALLLGPLDAEQVGEPPAQAPGHGRAGDPIEHLDVDGTAAEQPTEDEERHGDACAVRDDHLGTDPAQDLDGEERVAHEVPEVAGGRLVGPDGLLVGQQRLRVGPLERHPHPFVVVPPRAKSVHLRQMPPGGAHQEDPVRGRGHPVDRWIVGVVHFCPLWTIGPAWRRLRSRVWPLGACGVGRHPVIRLDGATFLLQWAVGGLAFLCVSTRRRELGTGYGWLLRGVFGTMALSALVLGVALGPGPRT